MKDRSIYPLTVIFLGLLLPAALLLAGCATPVSAESGEEFLNHLSAGELEAARAMVCADHQDTLVEEVMDNSSMIPAGVDMLGLPSPGLTNIECLVEDDTIHCTFARPKLQCHGDLFGGGEITCDAFDPVGSPAELVLEMSGEEICGCTFNDLAE